MGLLILTWANRSQCLSSQLNHNVSDSVLLPSRETKKNVCIQGITTIIICSFIKSVGGNLFWVGFIYLIVRELNLKSNFWGGYPISRCLGLFYCHFVDGIWTESGPLQKPSLLAPSSETPPSYETTKNSWVDWWYPLACIHIYGNFSIHLKEWLFHSNEGCRDFFHCLQTDRSWISPLMFLIQQNSMQTSRNSSSHSALKNALPKGYLPWSFQTIHWSVLKLMPNQMYCWCTIS